jgi:2-polyprenyl-3-methyl-5-hydroxy-6-metoxy-1,4-benzoquinol methylase
VRRWFGHGSWIEISVLWCKNCGLGRLHPFPSIEALNRIYALQSVYGLSFINESQGGFSIRIKRLSELIPQRGRLLDVGSGLGHFLKLAQSDGWKVEGIEPRPEAVKYCYEKFGIKVHEGFLENFDYKLGSYDVITLWDVLEHVYDHDDFIQRCVELLAPNGVLVFAIPNASGWPARVFKSHWRYVMPTHLHYFRMPYISRLLSSKNIHIQRAYHTFKIHSFIQGVLSIAPFDFNIGRIFRIGIESGDRQNNMVSNSSAHPYRKSKLGKARDISFKINMISFPWAIGDMMDLYCRKAQ